MYRIAFILLLAISPSVQGNDMPPPESPAATSSVWINTGFYSYHFDRDKGYRENNYGVGLQINLSPVNSIVGGEFQNSDDAHSRYLGWSWQPYQAGIARFGFWAGGIDGYPKMQNGGWFLAALPIVSVEYKAVGFNFIIVPSYQDKLHGAFITQLKFRIWE